MTDVSRESVTGTRQHPLAHFHGGFINLVSCHPAGTGALGTGALTGKGQGWRRQGEWRIEPGQAAEQAGGTRGSGQRSECRDEEACQGPGGGLRPSLRLSG